MSDKLAVRSDKLRDVSHSYDNFLYALQDALTEEVTIEQLEWMAVQVIANNAQDRIRWGKAFHNNSTRQYFLKHLNKPISHDVAPA
jgi:hypothetical protein